MNQALHALTVAAATAGAALAWLSIRTSRIDPASPRRLVAELRLAQLAALLLVLVAGTYVGFAVAAAEQAGTGLDIALALGFFVVAAIAPTRDPREALSVLALAFVGHALVDILHRPGALPIGLIPGWYVIGCAVYNVGLGALCYVPILAR